jgi:hypothetical protein
MNCGSSVDGDLSNGLGSVGSKKGGRIVVL